VAKTEPKESTITANIKKYINSLPEAKCEKWPGTQFGGGQPDLFACVKGKTYLFEVKRPSKTYTLTQLQARELSLWKDAGATAEVVTSVAEVKKILENA